MPSIDPRGRADHRALIGLLSAGALLLPVGSSLAQTGPTAHPAPPVNASVSGADAGVTIAEAAAAPPPDNDATTAPVTLPPPPAPIEEPHARLDYSDGVFYLRSANDNMVFVPGARAHIDLYTFGGPGVSEYHRANGTGLKTNLFFRRFVLEFGGLVRKKWFYWLGGNFAPTQVDAGQNPISTANVYDGFVGYMPVPQLRIYFGMYNAPFTMENVTSSRWLDLMERALIVRTVATPYNKAEGLMAWGDTKNKSFEYQAGIFGGDGMNRPNIDNRFDGMGRFVVRPLAKRADALQRFHVGGGARYGRRDRDFVRYDAPSLTTPGGYAFWSAAYGSGAEQTHILPDRKQWALAAETYLPFTRWDLRGEFVYVNEQRRETLASDRTMTLRAGALTGYGTYAQVSCWLLGTPRINGNPGGYYGVLKLPDGLGTQAPFALQLVLRGEWMRLSYDGNSRSGDEGAWGSTSDITVNAYQLGLNYWATKHVRLTAEYSLYHFPGTPITAGGGADNLAVAPGARSGAEPDASTLNEISFRVGLALSEPDGDLVVPRLSHGCHTPRPVFGHSGRSADRSSRRWPPGEGIQMNPKLTIVLIAMALWLGACSKQRQQQRDPAAPSAQQEQAAAAPKAVAQPISIDGSSTVFPISEAVAEEFQKSHAARVTVASSGTGGGFKKLCAKEIAITGASRPIKPSEVDACKATSVETVELPVAYDGIAVVVNPDNTWVDKMTVEELKKLWEPEAQGKLKTWADVRKGWPKQEIHLFGAGVDSGTYDYFTKAIVGEEHKSRGDFTSSEDDNVLVKGISTDKLALGFFGYAYYAENKDKLKIVPIDDGVKDNGDGPIAPSVETIEKGSYQPLSRPIFIYVGRQDAARAEVKDFVKFYLTAGQQLVSEVGYVKLPADAYALALKRFEALKTGSLFAGTGSKVGVTVSDLLKAE